MKNKEKKLKERPSIQSAYSATSAVAAAFSADKAPLKWLAESKHPKLEDTAEKILKTTCYLCHGQCGLLCHVRDGRLIKIEGNPDDPLNHGTICVRPNAALQYVYSPRRIKYPLKRVGIRGEGKWHRISWKEAISTAGNRLSEIKEKYGAETVYFGMGTGRVIAYWPGYNFFPNIYGSPNRVGIGHLCLTKTRWSIEANVLGLVEITPDYYRNSQCVVQWGKCPTASNVDHTPKPGGFHFTEALASGTRFIVIDPMFTREAARATIWLQVRPGMDLPLTLAWLNVIIREKLYDRNFVEKWTNAPFLWRSDTGKLLRANDVMSGGNAEDFVAWDTATGSPVIWNTTKLRYENAGARPALEGNYRVTLAGGKPVECQTVWSLLTESVREWTPEKAAPLCWVPADKIRASARMFGEAEPACINYGLAMSQCARSTMINHAILILKIIKGSFDIPGGVTTCYHLPWIPAPPMPPEMQEKSIGYHDYPYCRPKPGGFMAGPHTPMAYRTMLTGKPYAIQAFYMEGGNHLASLEENRQTILKAYKKVPLMLAQDITMNPTVEFCDIVFPVPTPFERSMVWGGMPMTNRISPLQAVIRPMWSSKSDYRIYKELAEEMGIAGSWFPWEDEREVCDWQVKPLGMTFDELTRRGFTIIPWEWKRYEKGLFRKDGQPGFPTPSGKVEIYVSRHEGEKQPPLPAYRPPAENYEDTPELAKTYPLILVTGPRELNFPYFHSMYHHQPWLREVQPWPLVRLNPETAFKYGIGENDWAWVETRVGKARFKAELYEGIDPRVVAVTHCWFYPELPTNPDNPHGVLDSTPGQLIDPFGEGTGREEYYTDLATGTTEAKGGMLCKVYKCLEGPPEGAGLEHLIPAVKTS